MGKRPSIEDIVSVDRDGLFELLEQLLPGFDPLVTRSVVISPLGITVSYWDREGRAPAQKWIPILPLPARAHRIALSTTDQVSHSGHGAGTDAGGSGDQSRSGSGQDPAGS